MSVPLKPDAEGAAPRVEPRHRRLRRLHHLQTIIAASYETSLQHLNFDGIRIELLRVAEVDTLLDRLPRIQFRPDERLPYWADLWPAALALAHYLGRIDDLHALPVLELGCGLGLAGIMASRKGGVVTFTDYEADALTFTRYNTLRNRCEQVRIRYMDWHAPTLTQTYARIIASDVLYDRHNFQAILHILQTALAPGGRFMLAEPNRPVARDFFRLLRDHGFRYERTTECVTVDGAPYNVSIYHGGRKA